MQVRENVTCEGVLFTIVAVVCPSGSGCCCVQNGLGCCLRGVFVVSSGLGCCLLVGSGLLSSVEIKVVVFSGS